jgi:hypothetical protein
MSRDGRFVAVTVRGSPSWEFERSELVLYDSSAQATIARLAHGGKAAFSPDGAKMAVASVGRRPGDEIDIVETRSGKTLCSFPLSPGAAVPEVAFSPDGASLGAVVVPIGGEVSLVVWDAATGAARSRLRIRSFCQGFNTSDFNLQWLGNGVIAVEGALDAGFVLLRLADGAVVRVDALAVGARMGYLATTADGVFDVQGLPPEAVRFRRGKDVAHAELVGMDQLAASLRRPGLVGDLVAGRSVAPQ